MKEAALRDLVAANIEQLEEGLRLLAKEQYIPGHIGTSSFIDLYATDVNLHHVLIELKRSDAAAREALHEVSKYAEAVRRHFGCRDDEIRILVASTEWEELLVPFSRFVEDTALSVQGVRLSVKADGSSFMAEGVVPVPISQGRCLAPWHELNLYLDEGSLQQGLVAYERCCEAKGIADYVLVVLDALEGQHEREIESIQASMSAARIQWGIPFDEESIASAADKVPQHRHVIYFAPQLLTREQCEAAIAEDPMTKEETEEVLEDMEEEAALCHLHEAVYGLAPRPHRDWFEIGYPAKFRARFIDAADWTIREIRRVGTFARNTLLTDDAVIEEIAGSGGETGQTLSREYLVENPAHMAAARRDAWRCLKDNLVWQAHVRRHLDEIAGDFPSGKIEMHLFNPCTGLLTLFFAASREDGYRYVPNYCIAVRRENLVRVYHGGLAARGEPKSFRELLRTYYDDDIGSLLMALTWGGYDERDTEILEAAGLAYTSYRIDAEEEGRRHFILEGERWRSAEATDGLTAVYEFLRANDSLVRPLVTQLGRRMGGGWFDASRAETPLDEVADITRGIEKGEWLAEAPDRCDICGCPTDEETYIIDGATDPRGAWGWMCEECFARRGRGIGWGTGQLYMKYENGWLMVGGFPDRDEEQEPDTRED